MRNMLRVMLRVLVFLIDCDDQTEKGSEEAYRDKAFKMEMRSLKVLQSVYSRQPFHKLMGKSFDRNVQLQYNGLDCCVEREIFEPMYLKLKERGLV